MAEKEKIFSSSMKYRGILKFSDFYKFCHRWLTEETGLKIEEKKYKEKLAGDTKEIEVVWEGEDKYTDYFKLTSKIEFKIKDLKEVQINENGKNVKTNQGEYELKITGTLVRDYEGKFDRTPLQKFIRGIYEKWIINTQVKQYKDKITGDCDEFLNQAKSYIDLEGKK